MRKSQSKMGLKKISSFFEKVPKEASPTKKRKLQEETEVAGPSCKKPTPNSPQKTPEKRKSLTPKKRTPKKLFLKSPSNLEGFNVEVLNKFVTVTPTKTMKQVPEEETSSQSKSKSKTQSSILSYISPRQTGSSKKAELCNEKTPIKSPIQPVKSPTNKVRSKLNFETSKRSFSEENDQNVINLEEFSDWEEICEQHTFLLDLTQFQRCKITQVEETGRNKVLVVESMVSQEKAQVFLEGFWVDTNLNIGDLIFLTAQQINEKWTIDNNVGLLVYDPDHLISTTTIVGAIFCKRKTVLKERFRGFDSSNKFMLVGTLVHQLLQEVLRQNLTNKMQIENYTKKLFLQNGTIFTLYECDLKLSDIQDEVLSFIPRILEFLDCYYSRKKKSKTKSQIKNNWSGTISKIQDIEENIWSPNLGIKGKIDVTIENSLQEIMPLELKTGRASMSLEHRGQIIMYIMMLRNLNIPTPSGLLFYLKEGILRDVPASKAEQRDLILLRNEVAYFLTKKTEIKDEKLILPAIPEPINHSACKKCEYNVICGSFSRFLKEDLTGKPLESIRDSLSYLSDKHLEYFMHWTNLIHLEGSSQTNRKDIKHIYTLTPEERESKGSCITNLKVQEITTKDSLFETVFTKTTSNQLFNFQSCGLCLNNYVIISTNKRPAIASGFVTELSSSGISLSLDRNLKEKYDQQMFHLDTYESTVSQTFNFSGLALLLENTSKAESLRKIIIDQSPAQFQTKLPKSVITKGTKILSRLNKVQQRAVLKALAAENYFLIKGMPGTGKTETIVALIQLLIEMGKSVLITSHTHSAVDNVCLRLAKYGVNFLRLGVESRLNPELKPFGERHLTKNCKSVEDLQQAFEKPRILAVTCLGSGHAILNKRTLDVCIVDESTQVLQTAVLRPLFSSKTFILIGDPDQLPTVVRNKGACNLGMSESLFDRLNTPDSTIALNLNYRMNKTITKLANELTYNGELLVANEEIANATFGLPKENSLATSENWIKKTLDFSLKNAVSFLDTGPIYSLNHSMSWQYKPSYSEQISSENRNCYNIYEAALVTKLVSILLDAGVKPSEIGVIATYRDQVSQIKLILGKSQVDINTVDQFQGKDKKIIIYSCSRSRESHSQPNKLDILEDKRRLNVAITRAKNKLILIGDLTTLQEYSTFQKILPCLQEHTISLPENFSWDELLDFTSNFVETSSQS